MFLRKFKWYRKMINFYQRGKKGYCDEDLWDLYHWFTKLFPQMLEDFLAHQHGFPCGICPSDIKDKEFWYKEQQRKWEYEVKKFIWNLKEANDETCSEKNNIVYDFEFEFIKEDEKLPYSKLNIIYPTEQDKKNSELSLERDKVIEKYKEEHFKAALTQFEKIARNLWD